MSDFSGKSSFLFKISAAKLINISFVFGTSKLSVLSYMANK
ncbi:Uncharacterized protein dnm_023340 [Desulfonema magnum]|uniref:Uncharacterized protein n=1 Tax=Desulfonema magnum TaxID=45655 RepID=A0A975BJ66_9BACT|nr:Uncharacterized protein dnm_023340 [Desulfonema magnum]